jgi:RNA polymerase sigma-70 factor (ECF subfamily)
LGSQNESKEYIDDFDRIIEEYSNKIFGYCYRMLRNRHEAEDAVQEVFIKAYKSFARESNIISVAPWLYRIAYNHCLNIIRRKKLLEFINITEEILPEQNSFEDDVELGEELKYALSMLSPEQRTVVVLKVVEDMEYKDIGDILGKKSENVRKIYERAKKKLQSCWNIKREVSVNEGNQIL